jgi:hypothetical protein
MKIYELLLIIHVDLSGNNNMSGTLLQNLTQDSATLTGWRRAKRSGEGKMIALYGLVICSLREVPKFSGDFSCEKRKSVRMVRSKSRPLEYRSSLLYPFGPFEIIIRTLLTYFDVFSKYSMFH